MRKSPTRSDDLSLALDLASEHVKVETHGLVIADAITDATMLELGTGLKTMFRGMPWWLGDYALSFKARNGERYSRILSERFDLDGETIRHTASACRFYAMPHRVAELSFTHHRIAMMDHDLTVATEWLTRARDGAWTVSRLRQEIARAHADAPGHQSPPEGNPYAPLDDADAWAIRASANVEAITADEAIALQSRFAALFALVDKIRSIAHTSVRSEALPILP